MPARPEGNTGAKRSGWNLTLLPRSALIRTGPVDEGDWNFRWGLGYLQRRRFQLAVDLFANRRFHRLLEVGYGSGVFLAELERHCEELYGIDPHPMAGAVTSLLAQQGIRARLVSGAAGALPFPDSCFDCVVAVSSLEFVRDVELACGEIRRVLTPEGIVVAVTPAHSAIADFGLKVLTGRSAKADFAERRAMIIPTLLKTFALQQRRVFPIRPLCLYTALRLAKEPQRRFDPGTCHPRVN